jgi:hypothetical protein
LTNNCTAIATGNSVKSWQQFGLNLASRIYGGRDVVIAIDLTESVGLNAEGRLRLTQIIEDSLRSGGTVYVVPFASEVNPLHPEMNPLTKQHGIQFRGNPEDIKSILNVLPFESEINLNNTDIQNAELFTYRGLAQLNQCRLGENTALKPQSIVWLTDAPLLTKPGIDSATWVETPATSPFRLGDSPASKERQSWLKALPIKERSQTITTDDNHTYQLSVVDLAPTVQEFCTPTPGGKETCLVTPYLAKLLLFPTLITISLIVAGCFWGKYLISVNKRWRLKISFESDEDKEEQVCYLKNKQKIAIGDDNLNSIYCPGNEIRGYLQRKGNRLYLIPLKTQPIFYREQEVINNLAIKHDSFRLNCPLEAKNFTLTIKLTK